MPEKPFAWPDELGWPLPSGLPFAPDDEAICCEFTIPPTAKPRAYPIECTGNREALVLPAECGRGCQGGTLQVVPCVGDCNRDARVTVEELVRAVGIVVGAGPYESCAAADGNEDGAVTVDEVVRGVRNVLSSCVATWQEDNQPAGGSQ
ncbi:MAG: hypothetical protein KatS3mg077_0767 [Candidatus Binatia bacterium]|nr:MAG: hypothetical protein KatS3mg077_0767 [Candidatus Binatia bacterium]